LDELTPFEPSISWSHELWRSLEWVAKAWGISAVATVVVLALLMALTPWGRQFWRVTKEYFTGPPSTMVWLWLAGILLLVIVGVRLDVLFSFQGKDMNTAIQVAVQGMAANRDDIKDSGVHGFWMSLGIFCIMAVLYVCRVMLDLFVMQRFILRWRIWLTQRLTGDWLDGKAYYRSRFIDDTIDNPDQRIQADIDIFTTGVGPLTNNPTYVAGNTLLFGSVNACVSVVSFTPILWGLSGTLSLFGFDIPRAMFWTVFVYVLVATLVAFWIGRPIIRLSFLNERFNAAFRYALVRLRDAAEAVAFYRGERAERVQLRRRFEPIVANYKRYINRSMAFNGWNLSVSQTIVPLPYILQAPRLFSGEIQLGDVSQTASAFGSIHDSLSFFRNVYDSFAGWRAAILRLYGLVMANEECRALTTVITEPSGDGMVRFEKIDIHTPDGELLISPLDLELSPGDGLVIVGRSGTGKTTLLRSLAQLWPFASGTLRVPADDNATMFLSQLPYVPLGDLRAVVSYPCAPGDIPDDELQSMLTRVALPHLVDRLDEVQDWAKVLSPGEQQRVAFARILLNKPKAVFLDEATSALDEGLEMLLYQLLRQELPDCIVVSVSHRSAVNQYHGQQLRLSGDGEWNLGPVDKSPEPV
jgi:vitamin B12/bleomycin/antimicrobial peptide transport system ATP-binding/permease protein